MPFATYIATESIAPGHVLNVQYTLRFQLQRADPTNEILKREQRSMSGAKETLHYGRTIRWTLTPFPVAADQAPFWEEFFDSTADGQVFVLDPYGSEFAPLKSMTVDRDDQGHTTRRVILTGDPLYSDMIEYAFTVSQRT